MPKRKNFFQAPTSQNDVSKPKNAKSIKKVVTAKKSENL